MPQRRPALPGQIRLTFQHQAFCSNRSSTRRSRREAGSENHEPSHFSADAHCYASVMATPRYVDVPQRPAGSSDEAKSRAECQITDSIHGQHEGAHSSAFSIARGGGGLNVTAQIGMSPAWPQSACLPLNWHPVAEKLTDTEDQVAGGYGKYRTQSFAKQLQPNSLAGVKVRVI